MKNVQTYYLGMVVTLGLLFTVTGCAQQAAKHADGGDVTDSVGGSSTGSVHVDPVAENAFIGDMKALPPDKRLDYVQGHPQIFEMIRDDPDKSKAVAIHSLLPNR
jgi:hypothetical protein